MTTVNRLSVRYSIILGEHKGKECSICPCQDDADDVVTVLFAYSNKTALINKGMLAIIDKPGWRDIFSYREKTCDVEHYITHQKGNGENAIYTTLVAQPKTLHSGDILASDEVVMDVPRRGFNSSVLIKLNISGWIEVASRLPIALRGNDNYKFPIELIRGDRLITDCLVAKDSTSEEVNWVQIFLDNVDRGIRTPSCVPLAICP